MEEKELLRVEQLCKYYPVKGRRSGGKRQTVKAVDGVSLTLRRGETLGVVGESGCGKSTLGQCILMLQRPTSGHVWFDGQELTGRSEHSLRPLRRRMQMVFQDPYSSLDPRWTVRQILAEPLCGQNHSQAQKRVEELAALVGLDRESLDRYPHEFSGGQRQRIGIARAFAAAPELVLCDEAVSALDVSIQAQIVNLLQDLKEQTGVSYLFISHDLSVVHHISDRIVVLYLGRVMEEGTRDQLFRNPCHPYTKMLLEAVPQPDPESRPKEQPASSDFPSPLDIPSGCRFRTRCPYCDPVRCEAEEPGLTEVAPGHFCACHFGKEIAYV